MLISNLIYIIRSLLILVGNALKSGFHPPDYVIFTLHGSYPDLRQPPLPFLQKKMRPYIKSLQELEHEFKLIAKNPQVKGVIFHLGSLSLPMSQIQALMQMIRDLQNSGKEVITWATIYNTHSFLLATAGNRILLQEGGVVYTLGFASRQLYMKNALDWSGIEFDVINTSPYKSAMDQLTRTDMSEEVREMTNWLMDSYYQQFIRAIAQNRGMGEDEVQSLIEKTPLYGEKAEKSGAVDGIVSAENLPEFLGGKDKPARLASWDECGKGFRRPLPPRPGKYIAVLRVQGNIVDGKSLHPPARPPLPFPFLFSEQTGDLTFVQQARRVLRDRRARAVLLYIESRGGSAAASEAITSILKKISARKPLVAMMGSIAGSGGYYVATPASHIVAQSATLTGSIGVIVAKLVNSQLLERLLLNRETIRRGQNDLFGSPEAPFTQEEREKARELINDIYELFIRRVGDSRNLDFDALEQVGGGKVWTGEQAQEHGLVDELGGLETALSKLRSLSGLPENTPLVETFYPRRKIAPAPTIAGWIELAFDNLTRLQKSQALLAGPLYFHQSLNSDSEPGF